MAPLSFAKLFSSRSSSRSNGSDRRSSLDSFESAESYVISLPSMSVNAAPEMTRPPSSPLRRVVSAVSEAFRVHKLERRRCSTTTTSPGAVPTQTAFADEGAAGPRMRRGETFRAIHHRSPVSLRLSSFPPHRGSSSSSPVVFKLQSFHPSPVPSLLLVFSTHVCYALPDLGP
ncbi:hypothetical protein C8Q74DRAFT_323884 [Fomes fomentarius]|nr:hypothetical protein C8Q74DRAFT_323884 [Fomes fomentarius]